MNEQNHESSVCPFCGAGVEPNWALCDECGKRLPWAPPKKTKSIEDLTDEELAARFAPPRDNTTSVLLSMRSCRGRIILVVAVLVLIALIRQLFGF